MSQANSSTPNLDSDGDYSTGAEEHSAQASGSELAMRIEALLYVTAAPVGVAQLADALQVMPHQVEKALETLAEDYKARGVRLQRHRSAYQLTTAPELAEDVQRFLKLDSTASLTRAALEVLSIIAYQQPVTRPHIDSIRGVNSDSVLRTLLRHGLIEEVGRSDSPGRPFLYSTTYEFLQQFGINSLGELPPLNIEAFTEQEGEEHVEAAEGEVEEGE